MRSILFCLVCLMAFSSEATFAQMKLSTKPATSSANETRYFTSIDGLMDGNADVILKETRQGKTVTSAVLDVCYPAEKGSDRKDRFIANLAVNGQTLTGTTQSLGDKLPVTVKLTRKPTGETFEFKGQIGVGQTVTEVTSSDNSDLSEKEFLDNQTSDDGITATPKDFSEVSPESIGIKDIAKPDWGDAVPIHDDEIPVFWACGVTPQSVIMAVKPEFCITHYPGAMLVTDRRNTEFAIM